MQLQLVGRDYFDPGAKIVMANHKLELWPGYQTSIRQHEDSMLLCCEIRHKVLRTDTVYEQIQAIQKRGRQQLPQGLREASPGIHRHDPVQQQDLQDRRNRLGQAS